MRDCEAGSGTLFRLDSGPANMTRIGFSSGLEFGESGEGWVGLRVQRGAH